VATSDDWACAFWTPDRNAYISLGQMYVDDKRFKANCDAYAPGLASFVSEAIKVFVESGL
jgi:hypothetical protein